MEQAAIFTFLSQLFVKWRMCRNACFVWDGFLRQNQSLRLNEITAHSSISNLRVTMHFLDTGSVHDRKRSGRAMNVWEQSVHRLYEALQNPHAANRMWLAQYSRYSSLADSGYGVFCFLFIYIYADLFWMKFCNSEHSDK
jgi:hypothetical protein